jgi:hypothetical protein
LSGRGTQWLPVFTEEFKDAFCATQVRYQQIESGRRQFEASIAVFAASNEENNEEVTALTARLLLVPFVL